MIQKLLHKRTIAQNLSPSLIYPKIGSWARNSVWAIDLTNSVKLPCGLKHNLDRFRDSLRNRARNCLRNRKRYSFRHRFRDWLRNWCRYRFRYGARHRWRCGNLRQPRFSTGNLRVWHRIGSGINHVSILLASNTDVSKTICHHFQLSFKTKTPDLWYWLIRVDKIDKHLKFICVYLRLSASICG